jgi:truncated hemoglobin YjbI
MGTIYDPIGGQSAFEAAVQRFQARVIADPDLGCPFDSMDLRRIMAHQVTLFGLFFEDAAEHKSAGR